MGLPISSTFVDFYHRNDHWILCKNSYSRDDLKMQYNTYIIIDFYERGIKII